MVRKAVDRVRRYRAKIDGNVLRERANQLKRQMKINQANWLIKTVMIEQQMKSFLANISDFMNQVYYIIFAKEVVKVSEKYSGDLLFRELHILQEKWKARGLNIYTLNDIKVKYVPSYPIPTPEEIFRLDLSLLDGPHLLG